ncbi:terpenoid synthase [Trematosphaeria pertusa]|uniref:Terpenoid synthase n=1 Tax=Trematosphaeria pertusa TaxID=390896 RepID=A0A6A6I9W3_9PLEO|nr:terpenoid synthase [Trematosphaeria pertusa]KAF2247355.1 terpenoid synthase [Trematosphaeria pertusa]
MPRAEAHKASMRLKAMVQGDGAVRPETPLEALFDRVRKAFLAVDHAQGMHALTTWVAWFDNAHARDMGSFSTFDEFVAYRRENFGWPAICGMLIYAMDIDISAEEIASVQPLLRPAALSMMYTNDYWSVAKELRAVSKGVAYSMDCTSALIKMEGLSEEQALGKVKSLAMQYEEEAMGLANELLGPGSKLPENVQRYVQGVYWVIGGTGLWSATCPRYHGGVGT